MGRAYSKRRCLGSAVFAAARVRAVSAAGREGDFGKDAEGDGQEQPIGAVIDKSGGCRGGEVAVDHKAGLGGVEADADKRRAEGETAIGKELAEP